MKALKEGRKVYREGWNARRRGLDMYLWYKPPTTVKAAWCHDPRLLEICEAYGGECQAYGCICVNYGDGHITSGWSAWDEDLLADDWRVMDE